MGRVPVFKKTINRGGAIYEGLDSNV